MDLASIRTWTSPRTFMSKQDLCLCRLLWPIRTPISQSWIVHPVYKAMRPSCQGAGCDHVINNWQSGLISNYTLNMCGIVIIKQGSHQGEFIGRSEKTLRHFRPLISSEFISSICFQFQINCVRFCPICFDLYIIASCPATCLLADLFLLFIDRFDYWCTQKSTTEMTFHMP